MKAKRYGAQSIFGLGMAYLDQNDRKELFCAVRTSMYAYSPEQDRDTMQTMQSPHKAVMGTSMLGHLSTKKYLTNEPVSPYQHHTSFASWGQGLLNELKFARGWGLLSAYQLHPK